MPEHTLTDAMLPSLAFYHVLVCFLQALAQKSSEVCVQPFTHKLCKIYKICNISSTTNAPELLLGKLICAFLLLRNCPVAC